MKVTGHVSKFVFDKGRFTKAMQAALAVAVDEALLAFLTTAENMVPVRTGMARGSLGPLAKYLGVELDLSDAKPEKRDNPEAGAALTMFVPPEPYDPDQKFSVQFSLQIGTEHYIEFEHKGEWGGRHARHAPWHSMKEGKKAFLDYIKAHVKENMPHVSKFFKRVKVQLG